MYNTQQGAFNAPQEMQQPKPTIVFDDEVKDILSKTYPEMINGMINLAIKRFAETKEFREYFVRKEFREQFQPKENEEELEENYVNFNETQATAQTAAPVQEQSSSVISAVSAW